MYVEPPRKMLHTKRSFGKYPKGVDSPAYDASEEDNDPLTDDAASSVSVPVTRHQAIPANLRSSHPKSSSVTRSRHHLAASLLSDSDGVDSPTYDGDVESSAAAGADAQASPRAPHYHHHHSSSSTSTLGTPISTVLPTATAPMIEQVNSTRSTKSDSIHPVFISSPAPFQDEPAFAPEPVLNPFLNPASFTTEDIQVFIQRAIDGDSRRKYKINPPPIGRPVRVYADGVYDLFHFGHALQLRQAKLSFPSAHLLVGVCSDELVKGHKAQAVMTHTERCEAVRHCRWVDEVVPEAPWVLDEEFLKKFEIDYVAHDEEPYAASGYDDVFAYVKSQGKFIPTRRTPSVSTSDLLERIVSRYRKRDFDEKFTRMGLGELRAEGSDYDEQSISSRRASRSTSRDVSPTDKSAHS